MNSATVSYRIENSLWQTFISRDIDHDEFSRLTQELKQLVFPELKDNASYGVGWSETDSRQKQAQMAYEIEAMIRHLQWKANADAPKYVVCSSPPLHYSKVESVELEKLNLPEGGQI